MILDELAPEAIDERCLLQLIEHQVPEGYPVEYKLELYGNSDQDKRELLKDISSFANHRGGHIVFGMREDDRLPKELIGIEGDSDQSVQRLLSFCRDCIQPRIIGLTPIVVPLSNGRWAIALRIPRSWNKPHRATFQNWTKYFIRNATGAHEASVEELRDLFTEGLTREARATSFVAERVARIEANQAPIAIAHGGRVILRVLPFAAFSGDIIADLDRARNSGHFAPIGSSGCNPSYNLYGLMTYRSVAENGYLQLFRNGAVETVNTGLIQKLGNGDRGIHGFTLAQSITNAVRDYVRGYIALDIAPPVSIFVTLTGVQGFRIVCGDENSHPLREPEFRLPTVTMNSFESGHQGALRPIVDAIWNAGGMRRCANFHDDGRWTAY